MMLASKGVIPPKEWEHDSKIYNKSGNTVATILLKKNIDVP